MLRAGDWRVRKHFFFFLCIQNWRRSDMSVGLILIKNNDKMKHSFIIESLFYIKTINRRSRVSSNINEGLKRADDSNIFQFCWSGNMSYFYRCSTSRWKWNPSYFRLAIFFQQLGTFWPLGIASHAEKVNWTTSFEFIVSSVCVCSRLRLLGRRGTPKSSMSWLYVLRLLAE